MIRIDIETYRLLVGIRKVNSSNLSKDHKGKIIQTLISTFYINLKLLNSKSDTVSICGYKVRPLDLRNLDNLFTEIFIYQSYYFGSEKTDPFIIDCGSNIGLSILYFKLLFPGAEIIGFEPDDLTFSVLTQNIAINSLQNIRVYELALWDREDQIDLFFDTKKPGSLHMSLFRERISGDAKKVSSTRLSKFIDREVDLLKLDVEGAELVVLNELLQSRKLQFIQKMIIEYHHHLAKNDDSFSKLLVILEDSNFGYQIHTTFNQPHNQEQYQDIHIYAYRKI